MAVYYLHNHIRCQTCRDMESMTVETVDLDFQPEVDSGVLAMYTIDVDDPGQEHFVTEFDVTGPTLVVAELDDEAQLVLWRSLERIWELSEAPVAYRDYVRQAIQAALAGQFDAMTADTSAGGAR